MTYNKITWTSSTPINTANLQNLSDGIEEALSLQTEIDNQLTIATNGKNNLKTAITNKGGVVNQASTYPTFDELIASVNNMYGVGSLLRSASSFSSGSMRVKNVKFSSLGRVLFNSIIKLIADKSTNHYYIAYSQNSNYFIAKYSTKHQLVWEISLGTNQVADFWLYEIDGYLYCHCVNPGTLMKIDTSGNTIWTRANSALKRTNIQTLVRVDKLGNMYISYDSTTGTESLAKYDSSFTKLWSYTTKGKFTIKAVDDVGNIICTYLNNGQYSSDPIYLGSFKQSDGTQNWEKIYSPYAITYTYTVYYATIGAVYVDPTNGNIFLGRAYQGSTKIEIMNASGTSQSVITTNSLNCSEDTVISSIKYCGLSDKLVLTTSLGVAIVNKSGAVQLQITSMVGDNFIFTKDEYFISNDSGYRNTFPNFDVYEIL